jgi:hypothetical protein
MAWTEITRRKYQRDGLRHADGEHQIPSDHPQDQLSGELPTF